MVYQQSVIIFILIVLFKLFLSIPLTTPYFLIDK